MQYRTSRVGTPERPTASPRRRLSGIAVHDDPDRTGDLFADRRQAMWCP